MQVKEPLGNYGAPLAAVRHGSTPTSAQVSARPVDEAGRGFSGSALRPRLAVLASVGIYAGALQYTYRDLIAPTFAYSGLGYRSPSAASYVGMVLLVGLVALLLPLRLRNPSDFVLWMLFCLAGAPSILIAQYNSSMPPEAGVPTGVSVALTMLLIRFGALARPKLPDRFLPRFSGEVVWIGLIAVAVITQATLLITSGVSGSWLALDDVYAVRSDFTQFYTAVPLLGYLVPMVSNVIDPVLIARGLISRSYLLLAIGIVNQYILYVTTGNKVILFSIPAIVGLAFLFRRDRSVQGHQLLRAVSFVALGTAILDVITTSTFWTSLILRRFIIVPGALTTGYVSVFLGEPKTHFADSPLKWLHSPYGDLPPSLLVGAKFAGDPTTNANASLFGHGFAAYGYAGMFIEGLALVPILWLIDTLSQGLSIKVAAMTLLMPCVALSSASVFTAILTHGVLAAAIVLAVLPREEWRRPRERNKGQGRSHRRPPGLQSMPRSQI